MARANWDQPTRNKWTLGYREVQVLQLVIAHVSKSGIPPSYDQICDETGISTRRDVSRVVRRLEARGFLRRQWADDKAIKRGNRRICLVSGPTMERAQNG